MRSSKLTTRLVSRKEACHVLCISDDSFIRHWQTVFTDNRSPAERKKGVRCRLFEDEVAEAVNAGGGMRGKAAVIAFRRLMNRM